MQYDILQRCYRATRKICISIDIFIRYKVAHNKSYYINIDIIDISML